MSTKIISIFLFCIMVILILEVTKLTYPMKTLHSALSDSTAVKSESEKENIRLILTALFPDYLQIKNSLSKNDSVSAQSQALQLLQKIKSSADKTGKSNIPHDWEVFMKYAPEARSNIESTSLLSEQRYFFGILSKYIIDFVKLYGMKNKTVYIFQCRRTGGGMWMSDFNDGKNPFLGPGNENCMDMIESKLY